MRVKDKSIIVTGAGGGIGEGIAHRLAQYSERQHLVLGANSFRQFLEYLGTDTEGSDTIDPVNGAIRDLPTTVVSSTLEGPFAWPDATVAAGDARVRHEACRPVGVAKDRLGRGCGSGHGRSPPACWQ